VKKIKFTEPKINLTSSTKYIKKTISNNFPNEGELTRLLEKKIKNILKVKYVTLTTSGTSAIYLALKASGIGKNDEVIIPNITFPATANAVNMTGAKIILVDISKDSLLIDLQSLKKKITKKTKAIIPVHISGRGTNIKEILKIAKKNKIRVIEDAAEAFGSKFKGKSLGSFGNCGCFSFAPNKIITTGQGGLIITNDKKIYLKINQLKDQGRTKVLNNRNIYSYRGFNFKFTDVQAGIGLAQINDFKARKNKLISIYRFYKKNISENINFKLFDFDLKNGELPLWTDAYCNYVDELFLFLKKKNINCRCFWHPINTLPPYKKKFKDLSNSKSLNNKLMWLPSSLYLSEKDLKIICYYINIFFKKKYKFL
tara:strand:- start:1242 stop:2351 length:1110 start_codon:yes stop_codon:yes gene_type:complete